MEAEKIIKELEIQKVTHTRPIMLPSLLKKKTQTSCNSNLKMLREFIAMIGDYRSIIILLENVAVSMCPSINPRTIALFIDWKFGTKNEILHDHNNKAVVDVDGNVVLNNGDWHNPGNKDQLLSVVSKLHETCNQGGPCTAPCEACYDNYFIKKNKKCCTYHFGTPLLLHMGNPRCV